MSSRWTIMSPLADMTLEKTNNANLVIWKNTPIYCWEEKTNYVKLNIGNQYFHAPNNEFFWGGWKQQRGFFFFFYKTQRDKFHFTLRDSVIKSPPLELLLWRSEISQTLHTIRHHLIRCCLNIEVMCSDVVSHINIPNRLLTVSDHSRQQLF